MNELEKEVARLTAELAVANERLAKSKESIDDLTAEKEIAEGLIDELNKKVKQLDAIKSSSRPSVSIEDKVYAINAAKVNFEGVIYTSQQLQDKEHLKVVKQLVKDGSRLLTLINS